MSRRTASSVSPLHRLMAACCVALVLALGIFAASPAAHEWLHSGGKHTCAHHPKAPAAPTSPEHDCAVVLFASAAEVPVRPIALTPPHLLTHGVSPVTAAEFYLVSPRYLRQPERGPPSLG